MPLLDRITAAADASHQTTITGAAGAVPSSSYVAAINLHTGHYTIVKADANGAFATSVFAPGGSAILLKCDPYGSHFVLQPTQILGENSGLLGLGGTVIHVPGETLSGLSPPGALPVWIAEARTNKLAYSRDETMVVDGTFTVLGGAAPGQTPEVDIFVSLIAVSRADGSGTLDQNAYCSTLTTPTGLPIEHHTIAYSGNLAAALALPLASSGDRLRASFAFSIHGIPAAIEDGYYRPLLTFIPRGIATEDARRPGIMSRVDGINRRRNALRPNDLLPIVRIGNPQPPRVYWTLFANTFSQGARGLTAVEDRDRFGVSSRIATSSDHFVIPRVDARSGAPIVYDLEPFAMTIAVANKGDAINPPVIPFRFPSGNLTVSIQSPGGNIITRTIGPAPFRQARLFGQGLYANNAGVLDANYFVDPYQLTTLDPRFKVIFVEDGEHEIRLEGSIVDLWGNTWRGEGTYLVDVGSPLEIDSALIPGTPLNTGDAINPSVQLIPAVPADVRVRIRFAPSSRRDAMSALNITTSANEHGYVHIDPFPVPNAGEYRVDVYASWRDDKGRAWTGTRTWGGVVAPRSSPIVLHGKRGVDDQNGGELAWFSRKQIGLSKDTGGHVHFAFHSGDVQWMEDADAAVIPLSIFDPSQLITPTLLQYCCAAGIDQELIAAGEAPFYSIGANGVDPHASAPNNAELWAYAYRAVERSGVRVREMVSDEGPAGLYWRFDDRYAFQPGTGANGDLPNDFKFQFGGAAFYGRALAQPIYATYASLFVLTANGDGEGTRVFPPFQGNGGGPSGGPLFTLKGREIEMFFHPTAVRAGTILTPGSTASFTGQLAPTLAANVEIAVTSPSGLTQAIGGQANATGYFYAPAANFAVTEPGVWRARTRVRFDGRASAGQVTQPLPSGDVLGSRDGEFFFYVADGELDLAPMPRFVHPADGPIAFTIVPPNSLTNIEVYYTTTMPGFILEEGKLDGLVYVYDAPRLARDFPNLDLRDRDGRTGADTITISLLLSGTDASGARRHYARRVTLQGEEIQMPAQPSLGRRRSVRR